MTLEELSGALQNRIGLRKEEADEDAEAILDMIGFELRLNDRHIDQETRQMFYILEEAGLLTTEREEDELPNGRHLRTHYWVPRLDAIMSYGGSPSPRPRT